MNSKLIIQERHLHRLKEFILPESGHERSAYILCSQVKIEADPWTNQPSQRFISHEVIAVAESEIVSSSAQHITWSTQSVVNTLRQAQAKNLTIVLVHSHPSGLLEFSEQDDCNESDLIQLAQNRNGSTTSMLSLIVTPDCQLIGRLWVSPTELHPIDLIQVIGERIKLYYPERGLDRSSDVLDRQALAFGPVFNQDLAQLGVGIVGLGGTGSAVCDLAARLGIRKFTLFDKDIVEKSNLNRLHNATVADAEAQRPKVEVAARFLGELGFGIEVQTYQQWINDPSCQNALRSCDIIFACTDDHAGRSMLNRFAYYYGTPVIDLGLAIEVSKGESPEIQALDGRVTVLQPGYPCLLCREIISPKIAGEQILKYQNPDEYERRKEEAYVLGEGDPSPSVVLFTTDVASMALQELVHRLQGFRGSDGAVQQQVRKFKLREDRRQGTSSKPHCQVCGSSEHWGIGDVKPFLHVVG
jgi:molybdopterin/thiamine biosynthesis adenylyltransferase